MTVKIEVCSPGVDVPSPLLTCPDFKILNLFQTPFIGPHSLDEFKRVIDINLVGTFNVCRLSAEAMAGQEPYNESGERGMQGVLLF